MEITKYILQYASWPIVALFSIFIFKEPISNLLKTLSFFKAGSLEVGFNDQLQNQGFTETQLKIIKQLSAQEIDLFLLVSFSDSAMFNYSTDIELTVFREALNKLESAGLLLITNPDGLPTNVRHNTTPVGKRVRAMLINSTVSLLHGNT